MNAPDSRFGSVVLLHDSDTARHVGDLAKILHEAHPTVRFVNPVIPVVPDNRNSFNLSAVKLFPLIPPRSLVIGAEVPGLFACALQEKFDTLDLSVFAINPPTHVADLECGMETGWAQGQRVVLYSSDYEPLRTLHPEVWAGHADYSFDVPWLAKGMEKAHYATAYLISAFMRGLDLNEEIKSFLPLKKDKAQSEAAASK